MILTHYIRSVHDFIMYTTFTPYRIHVYIHVRTFARQPCCLYAVATPIAISARAEYLANIMAPQVARAKKAVTKAAIKRKGILNRNAENERLAREVIDLSSPRGKGSRAKKGSGQPMKGKRQPMKATGSKAAQERMRAFLENEEKGEAQSLRRRER